MKPEKKIRRNVFRFIFTAIGLASLVHIIKNYGPSLILEEIKRSGPVLVFLTLTFIPTLVCYAISWMLATDHQKMDKNLSLVKKIILFSNYTLMSIAWNNLTPFLKVGGEPLKFMMLERHLPRSEALASTINYNIIHLVATAFSFIICAFFLVLFYDLTAEVLYYALAFGGLCFLLTYGSYQFLHSRFLHSFKQFRFRIIKTIVINVKVGLRRIVYFYKKKPEAFVFSLLVDLVARFIEGLTFYFGFSLIKHPISFLSASIIDVGRTFVDTIFFFIPYQIGSREEGVHFLMEKLMLIDSKGFLTVVLFYRFVEIFWIVAGYFLWVSSKSSSREVKL